MLPSEQFHELHIQGKVGVLLGNFRPALLFLQ